MKTSARNQLRGQVSNIHLGAVHAEVGVQLSGGTELAASLTIDSIRRLGLRVGDEILVLVKASMVILALDLEGYEVSARNRLTGTIVKINSGPINADVTLKLAGEDHVTATITRESLESLGFAVGGTATALFKASSVVIAKKA